MEVVLNQMTPTRMQKVAAGLAVGVIMASTGPVYAAERHIIHDREWRRHEVVAHRYWHGHPATRVVYAPPVVYEPPPVYQEPAGINLVVPLNFH